MKITQILRLHKHMVEQYGHKLEDYINAFQIVNIEPGDYKKIQAAHNAASYMAKRNYNTKFTSSEIYDAVLRIELYRQFFCCDKSYDALCGKYVLQKKSKPDLKDIEFTVFLCTEVSREVQDAVDKFTKLRASSSIDRNTSGYIKHIEGEFYVLVNNLNQEISRASKMNYPEEAQETVQNALFDFQIEGGRLVRSFQIKTESNESLKPFLLNVLLLISGIGTIPALVSFSSKLITGRYMFFDQNSIKTTPGNEKEPEDHLIGNLDRKLNNLAKV